MIGIAPSISFVFRDDLAPTTIKVIGAIELAAPAVWATDTMHFCGAIGVAFMLLGLLSKAAFRADHCDKIARLQTAGCVNHGIYR